MTQTIKEKFKSHGSEFTIDRLITEIDAHSKAMQPKEIVEIAIQNGVDGIAYTYNEPAIFAEFAHDTAKLAKKRGLKNIFVSNGYESKETFLYMKNYIDAINIDLKSNRPEFYRIICKADIKPVKENVARWYKEGIETEVTTLIIPGHNDNDEELRQIAEFLVSVSPHIPWHISAFHPAYKMTDVPQTPYKTLESAYATGKKAGLHYVYVGNVTDDRYSDTKCPTCGSLLVARTGYNTEVMKLDTQNAECKNCREKIYGVY